MLYSKIYCTLIWNFSCSSFMHRQLSTFCLEILNWIFTKITITWGMSKLMSFTSGMKRYSCQQLMRTDHFWISGTSIKAAINCTKDTTYCVFKLRIKLAFIFPYWSHQAILRLLFGTFFFFTKRGLGTFGFFKEQHCLT